MAIFEKNLNYCKGKFNAVTFCDRPEMLLFKLKKSYG